MHLVSMTCMATCGNGWPTAIRRVTKTLPRTARRPRHRGVLACPAWRLLALCSEKRPLRDPLQVHAGKPWQQPRYSGGPNVKSLIFSSLPLETKESVADLPARHLRWACTRDMSTQGRIEAYGSNRGYKRRAATDRG